MPRYPISTEVPPQQRYIIHRDIKGENIFGNNKGSVYVGDFGHSVQKGSQLLDKEIGTLQFMAPEVITTTTYRCTADIWSLGMTVIQMVNGKPPYYGVSYEMVLKCILDNMRPEIENHMPETMQDFLEQCLEWDASDRMSSAALLDHEFLAIRASDEVLAASLEDARRKQDEGY